MYTLQMLGGINLSAEDGRQIDAVLRKPKHLALLAYLSMPCPGKWHRRDSVLGIFWPDLDQLKARTSLRSALHTLRRELDAGTFKPVATTRSPSAPSFSRPTSRGWRRNCRQADTPKRSSFTGASSCRGCTSAARRSSSDG